MDESEALAEQTLRSMGWLDVQFEPDGNIPPDFLIGQNIAVEVRRLNQMHALDGRVRGLEEAAIPLRRKLERLLYSFGPPKNSSWFVHIAFRRPLGRWKSLEPFLREALQRFLDSPLKLNGVIFKREDFELEVHEASIALAHTFVMGGSIDENSGGFVVSEMLNSYRQCVTEKTRKIAPYKRKYAKWWLALIDHIGHGVDELDQEQFLAHAIRPQEWQKILIIAPNDPSKWFEF